MFARTSRYFKLPDLVARDVHSRLVKSKSLRLLPQVAGAFFHTLVAGDRLDHLAWKYYKQSRKWWRICDANPEFLSPLALLGKEPVCTARFPLTFKGGGPPPWAELLKPLSKTIGVKEAKLVEDVHLEAREEEIGGQKIKLYREHREQVVLVTYNRMNVQEAALAAIMVDAGFEVGQTETVARVGKRILIPPDVVG